MNNNTENMKEQQIYIESLPGEFPSEAGFYFTNRGKCYYEPTLKLWRRRRLPEFNKTANPHFKCDTWLKPIDQPTASKGLEDLKLDLAKQNGFETVRDFETHADRFHLLNEYDKMYLHFALSQQQPTLDIEKVLPDEEIKLQIEKLSTPYEKNHMPGAFQNKTEGFNKAIKWMKSRLSSLPQVSQQQNSEKEAVEFVELENYEALFIVNFLRWFKTQTDNLEVPFQEAANRYLKQYPDIRDFHKWTIENYITIDFVGEFKFNYIGKHYTFNEMYKIFKSETTTKK